MACERVAESAVPSKEGCYNGRLLQPPPVGPRIGPGIRETSDGRALRGEVRGPAGRRAVLVAARRSSLLVRHQGPTPGLVCPENRRPRRLRPAAAGQRGG